MRSLVRLLHALPLLLISPFLILGAVLALAATDFLSLLAKRRNIPAETLPSKRGASIVIPSWNGKELLEKYLRSVVTALEANSENEIIIVDNASSDGTVEFLRDSFPEVRVLALEENMGFGGGSNAGIRAAKNDIVVLLNNDMRVEANFLQPLLNGFSDAKVFSVACQIFFSDPAKIREETGLTQGWWENGSIRVRHRNDESVREIYPCFYGGGGSCAFDRRKFLELGGFDPLLAPFYMEDTDIGYLAWKRGWKVFYEPRSVVYHEHRGTIGKRYTPQEIELVLAKNFVLWCWKNIHEWPKLLSHFFFTYSGALLSALVGESPERVNIESIWRAFRQLPQAMCSRWKARSLAVIGDTEAFRRPLGGYFRDRFTPAATEPERLRVLFVSPYPIVPPTHGGGVLMYQTLRELVKCCDVHLIALLDYLQELPAHEELKQICASAEFLVRINGRPAAAGSILPHAVREFENEDLAWRIHRQIYLNQIDVLQLEYMPMGQYAGEYTRLASILFEHDVYFQSIARGWIRMQGLSKKLAALFEYLRALYYETRLLRRLDRVQACSRENKEYLLSFVPDLEGRIHADLRAGIDIVRYQFRPCGREPDTLLFLGSFRHLPNATALNWFTREVLPKVVAQRPGGRLVVIGSDPPPPYAFPSLAHIDLVGFVDDIREPLSRYAVFVCPILSGSGVRVKLLEAFASGIPVVSTRLGAEGLAVTDGEFCALSDEPEEFAEKIIALLEQPELGVAMAKRAREEVAQRWDIRAVTARLEASYRDVLREKRAVICRQDRG